MFLIALLRTTKRPFLGVVWKNYFPISESRLHAGSGWPIIDKLHGCGRKSIFRFYRRLYNPHKQAIPGYFFPWKKGRKWGNRPKKYFLVLLNTLIKCHIMTANWAAKWLLTALLSHFPIMNNYRKSETEKYPCQLVGNSEFSEALKREAWLAGVCPILGTPYLPTAMLYRESVFGVSKNTRPILDATIYLF